jgi:hypothetical protein
MAQTLETFRYESTGTGGVNNVVVVSSTATFNSSSAILLAANDEIGVFTSEDFCAGATVWNAVSGTSNSLIAYGDLTGLGGTSQKDGFSPNESMSYRLWKSVTNKTYLLTNVLYSSSPYSQGQFNGNSSALGMHIILGATIGAEVPTVTTTEPNISVCANESFEIGIAVSGGTAPFSYQWFSRQRGVDGSGSDTSIYRSVSGAVTTTLSVTGISQTAEYRLQVMDANSTTLSYRVNVQVVSPPVPILSGTTSTFEQNTETYAVADIPLVCK